MTRTKRSGNIDKFYVLLSAAIGTLIVLGVVLYNKRIIGPGTFLLTHYLVKQMVLR